MGSRRSWRTVQTRSYTEDSVDSDDDFSTALATKKSKNNTTPAPKQLACAETAASVNVVAGVAVSQEVPADDVCASQDTVVINSDFDTSSSQLDSPNSLPSPRLPGSPIASTPPPPELKACSGTHTAPAAPDSDCDGDWSGEASDASCSDDDWQQTGKKVAKASVKKDSLSGGKKANTSVKQQVDSKPQLLLQKKSGSTGVKQAVAASGSQNQQAIGALHLDRTVANSPIVPGGALKLPVPSSTSTGVNRAVSCDAKLHCPRLGLSRNVRLKPLHPTAKHNTS